MSVNLISSAAIQQTLSGYLESQQVSLTQLNEQLASGQEYTNLTDYSADDALNLINLQDSATQKQSYIGVINTVQARLSGYDTTMTDMESVISQAEALAGGNATYNATTAASIGQQAGDFLLSVESDLNQQINGRYIYAGSRYTTAPVTDLATLPASTLSPAIYTDGATLPAYDTAYAAGSVTTSITGNAVALGGSVTAGQSVSVTVNGTTYSYTETGADTLSSVATHLAAVVNAAIPGTNATGTTINVAGSNPVEAASSNTTSASAYAVDSASIDSSYTVQYGVTSDNPAFQQMIAGLRYEQAAGNTTNPTLYQTYMAQASSLLTSALTSLQTVHTAVSDNINTLTQEKTTQTSAISDLANQIDDIQQVNMTQVATELSALETQLQASYSATGTIEKLSIVNYL